MLTERHQDIIRRILLKEGDSMPRKYQNGKLEIRRDVSRPYYFVRITVPIIGPDGRQLMRRKQTLGFLDTITLKQAKALRAEALEAANMGKILADSQVKFKHVAQRFLNVRVPQLGVAAQAKYSGQIARHILPAFGEMKMCEIDRPAVEQWLTAKAETLSWWTRIDLKGILSAIFTTAADWKLYAGDNPTKGVRCGRKALAHEKRLLSRDDMQRLLGALDGDVKLIILTIFGTGLRISEVLGLRWGNIDLDAGTLKVAQRWYRGDLDEPKTQASERTRQLGPLVEEFKRRWIGVQGFAGGSLVPPPFTGSAVTCAIKDRYIFVGDDGLTPPDERDLLRYVLRPTLKRLGLYYPGFGWHGFRRQNISWRQQAGATPFEAQKSAGHASMDMTYEYSLTDAERERDQVGKMFERLLDGPEGKTQ